MEPNPSRERLIIRASGSRRKSHQANGVKKATEIRANPMGHRLDGSRNGPACERGMKYTAQRSTGNQSRFTGDLPR
jgi:hypothetical protein